MKNMIIHLNILVQFIDNMMLCDAVHTILTAADYSFSVSDRNESIPTFVFVFETYELM